jgi:hypothetical protein
MSTPIGSDEIAETYVREINLVGLSIDTVGTVDPYLEGRGFDPAGTLRAASEYANARALVIGEELLAPDDGGDEPSEEEVIERVARYFTPDQVVHILSNVFMDGLVVGSALKQEQSA